APEGVAPGELELEWADNGDGTCTVTGCRGGFPARLVIPSTINGLTVTAIGDSAFEDAGWLESVELPATVRSLGQSAFRGCSALVSVSLPAGLETVASHAFRDCAALESVELPEGVAWLDRTDAQSWSSDDVERVGDRWLSCRCLFCGCKSLRSVRVPASLVHVGGSMFSGCSSLASLGLPEGIASIGGYALEGCTLLVSVDLPSTLRSVGYDAFSNCSSLESLSLPEGVESLGSYAFSNCRKLARISLPSTLSEIGDGALRTCTGYTAQPDGTRACNAVPLELRCSTWAQYWAARGERYACQAHTTVVAPEGVAPGELELEWADNGDGTCTLIACKTKTAHITLPSTINGLKVTTIGESAFKDDGILKTVVLPDTVTTVEKDAFAGCASLENVLVPSSVESIDESSFDGCESLAITCESGSYASSYASARSIPTKQVISLELALVTCPETVPYAKGGAKPDVKVTVGDIELIKDRDYTVAYSDNTKSGRALVTVTAIEGSGYEGSQYASFMVEGGTQEMYRLYNPNSGEHFYTSDSNERDNVVRSGWNYEGIGWVAPAESNVPVYRLYNKNGGEHHYTMDASERDMLKKAGWNDEGIGWYSDPDKKVPLLREYNPNKFSCNHNYTTSRSEHNYLVSLGWRDESVAWYGVAEGQSA
ncbi:MAG: leucine-rich repeat domain-containing protein, partial [Atopobiaceae bacterium]|nr:leucine-rich repeat domain-containing protein [Atopobiaceae bacterium]